MKPSLVLSVSHHQLSAEGLVSGPSVIASMMADAFHLPFLLFLPLHQCCPRSVQHTMGLIWLRRCKTGTVAFWLSWASPGKGPRATTGSVLRLYKRLTITTCQHERKWVTHKTGKKTARSITIIRHNCCLFVICLSELLSLTSLHRAWTLPALSGLGVREGGKSSSLYQRELFFLNFVVVVVLMYFMLPHSMVLSL